MAVTVEELEIIVKAKADEALPILEKVQAKLDGIIKKSLPALQQAAGRLRRRWKQFLLRAFLRENQSANRLQRRRKALPKRKPKSML